MGEDQCAPPPARVAVPAASLDGGVVVEDVLQPLLRQPAR